MPPQAPKEGPLSPGCWVPSRSAASMGRFQPFPTQPFVGPPCRRSLLPLRGICQHPKMQHPNCPPLGRQPLSSPRDGQSLLRPVQRRPWHWLWPLGPSWGQLLARPPRREDFHEAESSLALSPAGSSVPDARGLGESVQQPTVCWQHEPGRRKVSKHHSPLLGCLCRSAGLHHASASDGAGTQRAHP